jgi:hypothetical protein
MSSSFGYIPGDIKSTNNGLQTKASADVIYASPSGFHLVSTPTDAATVTWTARQVMGGMILQGSTAAVAATLPTAASLVSYMNGASVYSSIQFFVRNTGANTITVTASTGVNLSGDDELLAGDTGHYLIVFSDVTPGSETAICYTIAKDHTH